MKHGKIIAGLAALSVASLASAASLNVSFSGQPGSNHGTPAGSYRGGLFQVTINNTSGLTAGQLGGDIVAGSVFHSFCIEISETVGNGNYNFDVNTVSLQGGNSPLNPQPLTEGTAFTYTSFRNGTLAAAMGWGAAVDTNGEVNAVQDALWYFQNQFGTSPQLGDLSNAAQAVVNYANANLAINGGSWSGIGSVRVLNLGAAPNYANQDMLALVPLPHAAGLAGCGLLVAGVRRRRSI